MKLITGNGKLCIGLKSVLQQICLTIVVIRETGLTGRLNSMIHEAMTP